MKQTGQIEKVKTAIQYNINDVLEENGQYFIVKSSRKPLKLELKGNDDGNYYLTVIERLEELQ